MYRVSSNLSYNNLKTPERSISCMHPIRPKTANRILPEVYHGSTIIHRTPGRHTNASLLKNSSSKKFELSRVQSSILNQEKSGIARPSQKSKLIGKIEIKEQRRIPMSKAEGEMILFREIFVKPKEEKLEQLKQIMQKENFSELLFDKNLGKGRISVSPQKEKQEKKSEEPPVQLKTLPNKLSFFEHQIQVQPPEGLNATIAAPLTPGGGWAPSIPPSTNSIKTLGLKDLKLRAKSGVQAGDVQREAHMSYALAVLNEEKFYYSEALKFYKRFFFCAKILDDPIGAALALNRLGIVYYNLGKLDKSIRFHLKHAEFSDKDNKFAAFYNLGISYRCLNDHKESLKFLNKSLAWANKRMDMESQCITLGQLGTTYKMLKEYKNSLNNLENCLSLARSLRNDELLMETCVALGHLCYEYETWDLASRYFNMALVPAKYLNNATVVDICSCNLGIVDANRKFLQVQNGIIERCKSNNLLL